MIESTSQLGLGKSKINKLIPHLKNGIHETYPSKYNANELNYKWDIEFDEQDENGNNVNGIVVSKSVNFKYKIGQIVTFKYTRNQYGIMFTELKATDIPQQQSFQKSTYNDPKEISETAMSVCQSAAGKMYELTNKKGKDENIQVVAKKFCDWVVKDKTINRHKASLRWNAISRAVEMIKIRDEKIVAEHIINHTLSDDIINSAEFFMKHIDTIIS